MRKLAKRLAFLLFLAFGWYIVQLSGILIFLFNFFLTVSLYLSAVEMPDYITKKLLLSEEFLRDSMEMFSVPPRGLETDTRPFQQKYLNIIDPLKENNNLGRSVSKGTT